MKKQQKDNLPFFQFDDYTANEHIKHAVFTRQGGVSPAPYHSLNLSVSVPDDKGRVYANRKRAYGLYGRDTGSVVHAHLVHGDDVASVTKADNGTWISRVDGIITDEPGCALTMNYADCAPIFLFDPEHLAIGLGHAGWQGAVKDLPDAMVRAMQAEFGSDPARLRAAIGPCIGPCCYEVGEPVIGAVHSSFAEPSRLLVTAPSSSSHAGTNTRPHFDLPLANHTNLRRAGVEHIEMSGLCTACHTELFFSHRAEKGRTGRFGVMLMLD